MHLRKNLFLFLLFPVAVNAAAVDFILAPQKPWRKIEERTCSVEFSGKGAHPYLWLRPKTLKPDTCYRLSFEAERGALPFAALIREKIGTEWKHRGYADDLQLPAGPRQYSFYFRVAEPAREPRSRSIRSPAMAAVIPFATFSLKRLPTFTPIFCRRESSKPAPPSGPVTGSSPTGLPSRIPPASSAVSGACGWNEKQETWLQ